MRWSDKLKLIGSEKRFGHHPVGGDVLTEEVRGEGHLLSKADVATRSVDHRGRKLRLLARLHIARKHTITVPFVADIRVGENFPIWPDATRKPRTPVAPLPRKLYCVARWQANIERGGQPSAIPLERRRLDSPDGIADPARLA